MWPDRGTDAAVAWLADAASSSLAAVSPARVASTDPGLRSARGWTRGVSRWRHDELQDPVLASAAAGAVGGALASWVKALVEAPLQKLGEQLFPPAYVFEAGSHAVYGIVLDRTHRLLSRPWQG